MVHDDIHGRGRAPQVMTPGGECLKNCQELLIVSILVQLHSGKGAGVKGNGVDLIVGASNGEDGGDGIVGGVGLYRDRSIGGPVNEHLLRLGMPYSVLTDLVVFPFLSLSHQINL